jgi:type IV pilus assembly protein PilX
MKPQKNKFRPGPSSQRGVSLVIALVMLIVLTLIGVSSMNTAIVELKMAGSAQQQGIALNRADELLVTGETNVQAIADDTTTYNFAAGGDGYYLAADDINVFEVDWAAHGLNSIQGPDDDTYVVEYMGEKIPKGAEGGIDKGNSVAGDVVYSFRITSRSATGKGAVRLVQSIYVTGKAP